MKISVITVCFNSAKTIRHTLESFFEQTHPDKELVIVDGGSTDDTLEVVRSFPQENVILISELDRGMYDAANKGLRAYTGDAVGMLNSDDRYYDSTVLEHIAKALGEADMVSGHLRFVRDHDKQEIVRQWRGTPYRRGGFRRGWMPAHPTFYARRKVVEAVGEFDLNYRTAADYDWMLRAHELHEFESRFVDRILVDMQVGGKSTSGFPSHLEHNFEALESRRRWLGVRMIDYALFAKPLRKVGQFLISSGSSN